MGNVDRSCYKERPTVWCFAATGCFNGQEWVTHLWIEPAKWCIYVTSVFTDVIRCDFLSDFSLGWFILMTWGSLLWKQVLSMGLQPTVLWRRWLCKVHSDALPGSDVGEADVSSVSSAWKHHTLNGTQLPWYSFGKTSGKQAPFFFNDLSVVIWTCVA